MCQHYINPRGHKNENNQSLLSDHKININTKS